MERPVRILLVVAVLALALLGVAAPSASARITPTPVGGSAWRVKTIRVFVATPALYREGIGIALRTWNENRVGVSFALTTDRRRANMIIVARNLPPGVDGTGTLGAASPAVLTLDTNLVATEPVVVGNTIFGFPGGAVPEEIALVAAHESGHVLGLNHTTGCSLMRATGLGGCGLTPPAGFSVCRFAQAKDLLALRRRYGGAAIVRANPYCRRSATPSGKVGAITVTPSSVSVAAKLDWRETTNTYGYVVSRGASGGGCPAAPGDGTDRPTDTSALTETWDELPRVAGRYCYAVWSKNGRGTLTGPARVFVDVTPPSVAPVTSLQATVSPTADGSRVHLVWTAPSGGRVNIYRYESNGQCSVAAGSEPAFIASNGETSFDEDYFATSGTFTYAATRVVGDSSGSWESSPVCTNVTIP